MGAWPAGEGVPASVRKHLVVEPWVAIPCRLELAQTIGSVRWPSDEERSTCPLSFLCSNACEAFLI